MIKAFYCSLLVGWLAGWLVGWFGIGQDWWAAAPRAVGGAGKIKISETQRRKDAKKVESDGATENTECTEGGPGKRCVAFALHHPAVVRGSTRVRPHHSFRGAAAPQIQGRRTSQPANQPTYSAQAARRIFATKTGCPRLPGAGIMPGLMKTGDWGFCIKPGLGSAQGVFWKSPVARRSNFQE